VRGKEERKGVFKYEEGKLLVVGFHDIGLASIYTF